METANTPETMRNDYLEKILKEEAKQAKASRVRMILSFIATALLITLVVVLIITARTVREQVQTAVATLTDTAANMNEVADQLKKVDFEALEQSTLELTESGTEAMNGINNAIEKIDELENMALDTIQKAADTLNYVNSIDIGSLNGGIEKLSQILTTLANFLSLFSKR